MKFKSLMLKDVADVSDGAHTKVERLKDGIPYITSRNVKSGNVSFEGIDYISDGDFEKLFENSRNETRNIKAGDVLIGIIGTFGNAYIYKEEDKFGISSSIGIIRPNKNKLDSNYLYHYVASNRFKKRIESYKSGSVQGYTNIPTIRSIPIDLPPLEEQKTIADTLSPLDNTIELNNKINKNLEQQAQEIFKHWFIDFEFPDENGKPYKSSGGEMVESELGMIPEGWEVKNLGNIIKICNGKRPPVKVDKKSIDFRYPILGAGGIMGYTNQFIYDEPLLVIGRVGTHGVVQKPNGKVWTSDNTMVIKSDYYEFVNITLLHIDYKSLNRGSTQPLLAQKDIKNQEIIFPDKEIIESFENIVGKFNEKINMNKKQNQVLSQLRDTLLPKLMNGEIRIPLD